MAKIEFTHVTRIPYEADEEPGMPTYKFIGLIHNDDNIPTDEDEEFEMLASIEIDGRDMDTEHLSGTEINPMNVELWGAFLTALHEDPIYLTLHKEATYLYYDG